MTKPIRPGIGQMSIDGIEVQPTADLQRVNTFSTIATPGYWGISRESIAGVTPHMVELIAAERIEPDLLGLPIDSEGQIVDGVALNGNEYRLVSRTRRVRRIGEVAAAASNAKYGNTSGNFDIAQEKAEEIANDVLTKKQKSIAQYLDGHLLPEIVLLKRVLEAAVHPGLRRRKEVATRMEMAQVRTVVFDNILDVVGVRRGWDKDKRALAGKSLDAGLLFYRSRNEHLGRWRGWLALSLNYDLAKKGVFNDRKQLLDRALNSE